MLIVEQLSSSHSHQRHHTPRAVRSHASIDLREEVFDVELAGLEDDEDENDAGPRSPPLPRRASTGVTKHNGEGNVLNPAYPITIGLVVHGLADGLALGMSMLSSDDSSSSYGLSLVVFFALAVHKGGSHYQEAVTFPYHTERCSSYFPCIYCLFDVDISLASRVQKAFVAVQRIDPTRGYRLLRVLHIFQIEASG